MTKYPKVPLGAQSPFEQRLRMKAEEIRPQRELRGCGDPNCSMCNPKEGEGSPMSSRDDVYRQIFTERMIKDAFLRLDPSIPYREAPSAADIAYNSAREAVEDFIYPVSSSIDWSDVIGNDEAKQALLEAVEAPVRNADLYSFYGMAAPRGCLLWGPPGCGKTMFAKAAASALAKLHGNDSEMLLVNGTSLQSMWVGETEKKIRAFFEFARAYRAKHGRSLVIFIDEADAILPSRNGSVARFEISNVSTFLAEMDGLKENAAYVILATNRPEAIDEAILRDGRVSHKVKVERPTFSSGREILRSGLFCASATLSGVSVWVSSQTGSSRLSNTSRSFWPQLECSMR